jgi:hypothetical protein
MGLSIIECPNLEEEIVHAVHNDVSISRVMVVRSEDFHRAVRKLAALDGPPVVIIDPEERPAGDETSFSHLGLMKPMARLKISRRSDIRLRPLAPC